jgi:tRNA pseudouridine38-40 synthase
MDEDVRAVRAEEAAPDFNCRFMAVDRTYWYRILRETRDPFRLRYAYGTHWELDVDLMQEAASKLVGRHDFRAFTEELPPTIENTVRRLFGVAVECKKDEVRVVIRGTAFLRGMMRRMSGALLEIGRGKRSMESFDRLLTTDRDQESWPVVLPANGLTLMRVRYGRFPRDCRTNPKADVHGDGE